jgi:hypothetical protein
VARTAERTLTVAHDPHDDVDTLNRLRRLHARPFGQIVCEPAPTGGTSGLARSILAALGKDPDLGPRRDPLWRLVDVHLRAERTRQLVVLRAHTLTYAPLRRLADITDAADIHLWLVVHTERVPSPVAQLLEGLAHDTSDLEQLLQHMPDFADDDAGELPAGAGPGFPYLVEIGVGVEHRRPRVVIAAPLPLADRVVIHDVWDRAHAWMTGWLDEHPDATYQQCADAVYLLARHGDSASEIYTRLRAALDAFTRAGENTDATGVDSVMRCSFGEIRPCQFNAAIARAAALADQTADPKHAALIALAAMFHCPRFLRELNYRAVGGDGSLVCGPWGGVFAIAPELRRFVATQHQQLQPHTAGRPLPFLPGTAHGRMSQPSIRHALAELDTPATLWHDPPGTTLGEGANADGRALLHSLTAGKLWPRPSTP